MNKNKTILIFWLVALFPIIFGVVGDLMVELNLLRDDGSGGLRY